MTKDMINDYYKFDIETVKILKQRYLEFWIFKYLISSEVYEGKVSGYYQPLGLGIGNRIKNMISYLRATGSDTISIHWADEGWVSAKFLDLFQFEGIKVIEDNKLENTDNEPDFFRFFQAFLFVTKKDGVPYGLMKDIFPINYKEYGIDHCYNKIPEDVKNIYRPYFAKLKPSSKVKDRMNDFYFNGEYVSLQVRNAPDWDNYFKNTDLEKYFEIINSYPENTFFYLSCMNEDIFKIFKNKYGNRILQLPNKDYSSMIDAVAELYIMSEAKEMIVSFISTFSECAYWLGGAVADVKIAGCYEDFIKKGANAVGYHKESKKRSEPLYMYKISSYPMLKFIIRKIFSVHNEYNNGNKSKVIVLLGKKLYI